MKILLIEDDIKLKEYVSEYLEAYGYSVSGIDDFDNVMDKVEEVNPDLIVLDINLPSFDGFYFLKLIRKLYNIPVIILSARSDEGQQIRGMEIGADDYVTKPFSIGILLAKINALLRRVSKYSEAEEEYQGGLSIIHDSMKLNYQDKIIDLTKNEYRILNMLLNNVGKIITREDLLEALWDDTNFIDDNTLTVNMTRVKKKLSNLGVHNAIITKRGVGYVFSRVDS
ncbi:response regulator transcription factor [Alkaliphilus peptidifermentans]|uniref:Stage 0 sporulation protein A homolog n=1 Tax=Alkaliphilus peptidifermentans DSM 18978 TaxID=1120976 RepID=A0A1G5H7E4_9FIRM|nr:response regulator transcription factor [Alkaliphilus peptidifermentans]SCY59815.1 DNA-binding response regulator, OmpR family, contains REC and winged-helix (wHTH) domain [Alkaliphilus peptidifermentans DSM 18978]